MSNVVTAPTLQAQAPRSLGKCVMLVDDEAVYIDLLEQLLAEHLSCPVHSFNNASDALQALPNLDVGLIVTDYNMPEVDGLQFLAEVRRRLPHIPAVMITGYQISFTEQQMAKVPNLKVIVRKPFKWTALAEHITRYWSGSTPPFSLANQAQ